MLYILINGRQSYLFSQYTLFNCKISYSKYFIRVFCSKTPEKKYNIKLKKQKRTYPFATRKKINDDANRVFFGPLLSSAATKAEFLDAEAEFKYQSCEPNKPTIIASDNKFGTFLDKIDVEKKQDFNKIIEVDNSHYFNVPRQLNISVLETFKLFNFRDSHSIGSQILENSHIPKGNNIGLPSVTTILNETISPLNKEILKKWEEKKIKELGEAGFANYKQGLFDRGTTFHECIEVFLRNQISPTESQLSKISEAWSSLRHVLKDVKEVKYIESRVVHPQLHYYGIMDCVARYRDAIAVIEFKTSSRPKLTLKSTHDDPLQLMAYLGALSFDPEYRLLSEIKQALLVVAYPTGLPADAHILTEDDCIMYWRLWCRRLAEFWKKRSINNGNLPLTAS